MSLLSGLVVEVIDRRFFSSFLPSFLPPSPWWTLVLRFVCYVLIKKDVIRINVPLAPDSMLISDSLSLGRLSQSAPHL